MTFPEACLALGLIDDDEEWSRALQKAVSWMMPGSIRLLFVRILIHCQPVHPNELWDNFKDALSENFLRLYGDHTRAYNLAYSNICETWIFEGHDIANFPLMPQLVLNNHIEDSNELHGNLLSDSSSNIVVQSKEGQFFRQTDGFVWDETPMASPYALYIMDRSLKDMIIYCLMVKFSFQVEILDNYYLYYHEEFKVK